MLETDEKLLKEIGSKMRELRIQAGFSSFESFALEYELSIKYYWKVEKGQNMSLKYFFKLLKIHNLNPLSFFQSLENKV